MSPHEEELLEVDEAVGRLQAALRLQYRSALAYTVAAGSVAGFSYVHLAESLWRFAELDLADARRLVEKIVTLGAVPTTQIVPLRVSSSPAELVGSLLIAAAGNDGNSTLKYPAAYPQVVSVAALDANDNRASFSNANADVELAAAGVNVLSTKRGGGYVAFSGTSMATPHVSGVASVVAGELGLTGTALRNRLNATADDITAYGVGRDTSTGFGRVNLNRALGG